jgi:hypothetical protein
MTYLEITLTVDPTNRAVAAAVYTKYREVFLQTTAGAVSKQLLVRDADVQVLHGFASTTEAEAYLQTTLFSADIVGELSPLLTAAPEIRIYDEV